MPVVLLKCTERWKPLLRSKQASHVANFTEECRPSWQICMHPGNQHFLLEWTGFKACTLRHLDSMNLANAACHIVCKRVVSASYSLACSPQKNASKSVRLRKMDRPKVLSALDPALYKLLQKLQPNWHGCCAQIWPGEAKQMGALFFMNLQDKILQRTKTSMLAQLVNRNKHDGGAVPESFLPHCS